MAVAHAEHTLTNEQVVFAFGPDMTPVIEVDPGAVISLAMKDGLGGQITSEEHLIRDITTDLDLNRVNGATGPVAVHGAEPGDSLIVEILEIRPAETGVALTIPGIGQLQAQVVTHDPNVRLDEHFLVSTRDDEDVHALRREVTPVGFRIV